MFMVALEERVVFSVDCDLICCYPKKFSLWCEPVLGLWTSSWESYQNSTWGSWEQVSFLAFLYEDCPSEARASPLHPGARKVTLAPLLLVESPASVSSLPKHLLLETKAPCHYGGVACRSPEQRLPLLTPQPSVSPLVFYLGYGSRRWLLII